MSSNLDADSQFDWLALYSVEGLGNVGAHCLLRTYNDPVNIFRASYKELEEVEGVSKQAVRNIVERRFALDPEKEVRRVEKAGARIIPFNSKEYPPYLREIHDPPIILYAKGLIIPVQLPFIAVVGSRNPTHYGNKVAMQLGKALAEAGVGVVSGMARGIDGASQWGCLNGGGYTIGVIGTGLDVIYPASNKKLFEAVWEKGTVISEFPMGTSPEARHFPIRNRIISGISMGVLVVEATRKSGSLITAGQALEQGRDVFAVPGSIFSPRSEGTHFLIKQGAKLVDRIEDILEDLLQQESGEGAKSSSFTKDPVLFRDRGEEKIYEFLGDYPKHIDEIVRELRLEPGEAAGMLLNMELSGLIKQLPGKMFVRA
ncbi:MAG: DNA-protecting protein DprA [Deltaproteobacteria bacterium]|nr:MAG: DNA-protecting protein DprA [Deltaproteobacteria bacterium]